MKLEVGQFVRTKEGYICKILKLNEPFEDDGYLDHNDIRSSSIQEKNVVKASHNIIDLIEPGDYVNGELVLEKVLYGNNAGVKVFGDTYFDDEIQSIVTKQQFSAMEYKID